jgi:hypothetical protein
MHPTANSAALIENVCDFGVRCAAGDAGRSAASSIPMRTFQKSLGSLREIVNARGNHLRSLGYHELQRLTDSTIEHVIVDSKPATIATIIEPMADNALRVVVQGFVNARLLGKHVALDGFYKYPDGIVKSMPEDEFFDFD